MDGISLPARPESVRRSRRFVARAVAAAGFSGDVVDLAAVATSELVTNAVVHGRDPISVRTVLEPTSLRVEVHDAGEELPRVVAADTERSGGRGLAIVAAFASDWGFKVASGATGKSVWFTMDRSPTGDGTD